MIKVKAKALDIESFSKFGEFSGPYAKGKYFFDGGYYKFFRDTVRQNLGTETMASYNLCRVVKREPYLEALEYHDTCEETILPLDGDIIMCVAPAVGSSECPKEEIEAFLVKKGTVVTVRAGVWHGIPFTVDNKEVNILCVLPERTYMKDLTGVTFEGDERVKVSGKKKNSKEDSKKELKGKRRKLSGYVGKILNVDLTKGKVWDEPLDEDIAAAFIGGYGLGAKLLFDRMDAGVDPLSEDSILGFVTGPLTGSPALFSGRFAVVCKSPASQTWNDANSGGYFGPELKRAGYDAVLIKGKSEKPVYLWINDGKAEIRDAGKYWGMDSHRTLDSLKEDLGDKVRSAVIGAAGENQSLMAAIIDDYHRAAGRGGPGAVMGSKNLKAVVARGTGTVPVAYPEKLKEMNQKIAEGLKGGPLAAVADWYAERGTAGYADASVLSGDCPVNNWGEGTPEFEDKNVVELGTIDMDKYKTGKYRCSTCPMGCGAHYERSKGSWPLGKTTRPEYETIGVFGPQCGHTDVDAVMVCNEICNRAGFDTISAGGTLAWAMECFTKGIITLEDTGGIDISLGNAAGQVEMMRLMERNEGFGKILSLGSLAAAKKLGKGEEYVMAVRGIELATHDPRLCPGYSRTYQYDPTPGRHTKGGLGFFQGGMGPEKYELNDNGAWDVETTTLYDIFNAAGLCYFVILCGMDWKEFIPELMEYVTGVPAAETLKAGYRVLAMRQLFNVREGLTRKDFNWPDRIKGAPPLQDGPLAGITIDNEKLADFYFQAAGYDVSTGIPLKSTIKDLGYMDEALSYCL